VGSFPAQPQSLPWGLWLKNHPMTWVLTVQPLDIVKNFYYSFNDF